MGNHRQYPIGAEVTENGVHFRVWAPLASTVTIVLGSKAEPNEEISNGISKFRMDDDLNGYKSLTIPTAKAGDLYQFLLDDDPNPYPDPASRFQPSGPHGPSMIIDPVSFQWTDNDWSGVKSKSNVIYEMHVGTFTRDGTYRAAAAELEELSQLGITVIELMPVGEFDGEFGWGYDGVDYFAPYHAYGNPDDLRYFINKAHSLGVAVILDVVYNHAGSSGCYLKKFSPDYFSSRYTSEWGDTFNFDGKNSEPIREFFISNTRYWIEEFHFDGFRFDATQQIFDDSAEHILAAMVRTAREVAKDRELYISAENEPQDSRLIRPPEKNGYGFDALWNDDFHHSAVVAATGRTAAYYSDYTGSPQEIISNLKYGFLYQGQYYRWQKKQRGSPALGFPQKKFIHYLQNHDQVANGGRGKRLHQLANPALVRALTTVMLLGPQSPLLFQGQEFGASAPFLYFADNPEELAEAVAKGRNEFLHQFPFLAQPEVQPYLSRPDSVTTFLNCKLNFAERESHREIYQLHKDLLTLRRDDEVFNGNSFSHIDGALISTDVFLLRFFSHMPDDDRLLIINFGRDIELSPIPEPLLAPHAGKEWVMAWSSEAPQYGGHGSAAPFTHAGWVLPALSATLLTPQ